LWSVFSCWVACFGPPFAVVSVQPWFAWRLFLLSLFASSALIQPAVAGQAPARITKVERYGSEKAARVVIHVSRPVSFELGAADASPGSSLRLHLDIADTVNAGPDSFEMDGLIERVRLLPIGSAHRVWFDLFARGQQTAFFLPDPFRIIVDVSRREPRVAAPSVGRVVHRMALDPGHGGSDPGARGVSGLSEKDIVLDVAHRAAPLLARELGIATLLTRDTDVRVPLEERVARANAFGADLFISIHCNAYPSRSARGVRSFVLDGSHDHHVSSILERENGSPKADGPVHQRFLQQFGDTATVERSTTFAHLLQRAALASLVVGYPDTVDGGVHGAGFYVLAGARMPAVLFETSFVSNAVEERHLGTARYRQKLADAIVNAVRAYRAGYPARPP
jgi:N-acetylmuramoyl-L-alanine amidase